MGYADLHIHTIHSYDATASVAAVLKHVANHTDLDVIAITDHDTISGINEAMDLAPRYGIEVIPGCEVSTADGHLLALFIHRPVPAGLSLIETVELIGAQGGICIAAHPMAFGINSLKFTTIFNALLKPGISQVLVGVEAFNGSLISSWRNPMVEQISRTLPLAQTGNSDSHILETIGQGSTEFAGHSASDLRRALVAADTRVRKVPNLDRFGIIDRYLPRMMLRKMGWVTDNRTPQTSLYFAREKNLIQNRQSYSPQN